jgi:hypothetical protein
MEKQTENINLKVSPAMKTNIEKLAKANGLKVGPYIKMILIFELNKIKNQNI